MLRRSVTYFIPGMAATAEMFYKQQELPIEKVFLNWKHPRPGESLTDYAKRYLPEIDQSKGINIVGVSFGGILAQELAELLNIDHLVLISTPPDRSHLPRKIKWMRFFPVYKFIPGKKLPLTPIMARHFFGIQRKADVDHFLKMVSSFDMAYIKWAMGRIASWKRKKMVEGAILIMGDADRIFEPASPYRPIIISGGTHYMVVNRSNEINAILLQQIQDVKHLPLS